MNTVQAPSVNVLDAFSIVEEPVFIHGGQGTTWKAGKFILKPISSEEEVDWCATTIEKLPQDTFRIPKYLKTTDGKYSVEGWCVLEFIKGQHLEAHWEEKIAVCRGFNNLLIGLSKPDFILKRTNPWAIADKMVFEKIPLSYDPRMEEYVVEVQKYLKPIDVEEQIIHGDITGNMLFADGELPGIIDFTPNWKAKEYALAILVVDAITWENADETIFNLIKDEQDIFQLLLRAAFFRTLVTSEFFRQFGNDRLSELDIHTRTLKMIIKEFA